MKNAGMLFLRIISAFLLFELISPRSSAKPVEIIPPELRGAVQPQVAVSPDGRIHIVFGRNDAIFYTSSPNGRMFSPSVKVGALEKLALRRRRGPRVAAT